MDFRRCLALLSACLVAAAVFGEDLVHVLKKGETLYGLAKTYGVSAEAILKANNIADADRIMAGQKLRIPGVAAPAPVAAQPPAAIKHTVAKGETLYGIAKAYGVSLAELRKANGLAETAVIKEGQVLKLPANAVAPGGAPPAVAKTAAPAVPAAVAAAPAVPPPAAAAPAAALAADPADPRQTVAKATDPAVVWPIDARSVAYMTGKLQGVVVAGDKAATVRNLSAGTVVSAGPYRGFGRVAIVQTVAGYLYVYGGCESLAVKPGDQVAVGAALGALGVDALSGSPQLFFLVYKGNAAIDPAAAPRS
jgi:LysM repeat protein